MSAPGPTHSAVARLHEVTFLLVKLEVGGASDAAPAAALLREIAGTGGVPGDAAVLLRRAADRLDAALERGGPPLLTVVQDAARLVDQAADTLEGRPTAEPAGGEAMSDPEMLDGFAVEAIEFLEVAEQAALDLDGSPASGDAVDTLFRCFHTLKGTAGFLDLPAIVGLAHRAESLLSVLRDSRREASREDIDLILRSLDVLRRLVEAIGVPGGAGAVDWLELGEALDSAAGAGPASRAAGDPQRDPAGSDPEAPAAPREAGAAGDWTRVRTGTLDDLIEGLGELMVAQSILSQDPAVVAASHSELAQKVWAASRIVRELQTVALSMRTVTLAGLFRRTARLVRDLGRSRGMDIGLELEGESTRIDRNMVDLLSDPLVHMIRNAVDHGIESPSERRRAGKPEAGQLRLRATNVGSEVVLELSDDGRGIDRDRIRERAIEGGLVEPDIELDDAEWLQLVFLPGFSTAREVTDISGRGVGMDVVRRNIEVLRGRIEIQSEPGTGSVFRIRVPLTLAITDGLLVRIGAERYIVPSRHVHLSFRPESAALIPVDAWGERVRLRDEELQIIRLHELLGVDGAESDPSAAVLVVVGSTTGRRALLVDEVLAQAGVVTKPLGSVLDGVRWISEGAILGDGRVGLVLDVPAIVDSAGVTAELAEPATGAA